MLRIIPIPWHNAQPTEVLVFDSRSAKSFGVMVCVLLAMFVGLGAGVISNARPLSPQSFAEEKAVWDLERSYWHYVEINDLTSYLNLWHPDFLGWPRMNPAPVGKDHITDWITSNTAKGLTFKMVEFKPAALRVTGNTAVACYWATSKWVDRNGAGEADTARIIHTWVKTGKDWQIIGGMSMTDKR
jgi:ketosteroid isomerase-like protein